MRHVRRVGWLASLTMALCWSQGPERAEAAPGRIQVVKASLGHNCNRRRTGGWTRQVASACNGKPSCTYRTPRQRRSGFCTWALAIEYHCGDRRTKKVNVPGDAWSKPPATLSCPAGAAAKRAGRAPAPGTRPAAKGRSATIKPGTPTAKRPATTKRPVPKRAPIRFRFKFSKALRERFAKFRVAGLARLRRGIIKGASGSRGVGNISGLGTLVPIKTVVATVKKEVQEGKKLPGDPWFKEYERWEKTPAKERSKTAPGELSGDDKKKFDDEYVGVLVPDLKHYIPFIFDVVFSNRKYNPKDLDEAVWLLYQYGCRQISRLMPGFAKIVKKTISNEVDLVGSWNQEIPPQALKKALGQEEGKGKKRKKPKSYAPKKEIIEICTVTHRQLEETLKKDLGLIARSRWSSRGKGRTVSEESIQPLSGLPTDLFPASVRSKASRDSRSRANVFKKVDVNKVIKKGGVGGAIVGGLVKLAQALKNFERVQRNFDHPGGDYRSFNTRGTAYLECQTACAREQRCRAFTFQARSRKCWLKSRVGKPVRKPGFVTGKKKPGTSSLTPLGRRAAIAVCAAKAGKITVTKASLGHNCNRSRTGGWTLQVARACNNKAECTYRTPRQRRGGFCSWALAVEYHCGDRKTRRVNVPGDAWSKPPAKLSCGAASGARRPVSFAGFNRMARKATKGRRPAKRPAASGPKITVTKASLGHNCNRSHNGNWTRKVAGACNGKARCTYRTPKQRRGGFCTWALDIEYHCGDRKTKRVHRDGDAWSKPPADLVCGAARPAPGRPAARPVGGRPAAGGPKIKVVSASLGHNCNRSHIGNWTRQVAGACDGKVSCDYRVPRQRRGGFCTWAFDATYECGDGVNRQASHLNGDAWDKGPSKLSCRGAKVRAAYVTIEPSTDRPGADYRNLSANSAEQCKSTCAVESKCRSFTWVKSQKKCYLKTTVASPRQADGMWSGIKSAITVTKASLGHNCGSGREGNWTSKVQQECNGKLKCPYKVKPQRRGGFCTWAIDIEYHCGDPDKTRTAHRDGDAWGKPPADLNCEEGFREARRTAASLAQYWKRSGGGRKKMSGRERKLQKDLFKDMGESPYSVKELKGETFHEVAKRLLAFYRKTGSARNFELAVSATGNAESVKTLAKNVEKQAPPPAKADGPKGDLADATDTKKGGSVETRTRRELLRRKVEQWTYGYEYDQLKPVMTKKGGNLLRDYKQAEQLVLKDFWTDCEELRAVCENPRTPSEKHRCVECAKAAMYNHCIAGKDKRGHCKDHTSVTGTNLDKAVNGVVTRGNWKDFPTKLTTRNMPNGNTFLNWLELQIGREAQNPNLIRGNNGKDKRKLEELAARHVVSRIFLPEEVDQEKGLSNEGMQQLDSLPVSTWQRCVLYHPHYREGSTVCDQTDVSMSQLKKHKNNVMWHQALLFKTALEGPGLQGLLRDVNSFWSRRCSRNANKCREMASFGLKEAGKVFGGGKDGKGFNRDGKMRDAGDAMGNTLGPVVGKLLGLLLQAAGMYETMKTLAKAAGLTPEQSVDCEDPEYRHDVLQIKACDIKPCGNPRLKPGEKCLKPGEKVPATCMDNKRGCLLKVFAKNFVNVLESIIIMLGNKLVDWGVDLIRTLLQPVKSAIIAAAGSVPFVGGVLATIVDIAWELLMNFGAKMLLKSFVVAKLPEWLKIRELSKQPIDKLFDEPIVATVMGIILQLIQAAVDYGDKSVANVAAASVLGVIQEALLAIRPPPHFWIRALMYAKREFAKDNITTDNPLDVGFEIAIRLLKGFKAAMARKLAGTAAENKFNEAVDKLIEEVDTPSKRQAIATRLTSDPIKELTRLIGGKIGPIAIPIITAFVKMPEWAKAMVEKFGENFSKTINELLPPERGPPARPPNGLVIVGRVVDVLKPGGKALLNRLSIDQDLKNVLLGAYDGITGALGEDKITEFKAKYLDQPWNVVKGVVDVAGGFIKSKLADLIQDPKLEPEKNLVKNLVELVLQILGNETTRDRIFKPSFKLGELLKELAGPLGMYATERLQKLTAGTGLEGLVMLLVDEIFGADGPFFRGASYFTGANLLRRLETRGPQIASHAMDAVAGLVTEKGFGGPILGSLVTGVAAALRKAVNERTNLTSAAAVLGLVKEAFYPVVDTLVAEIAPGGATSPLGGLLRGVLRGVLNVFGDPSILRNFASQGVRVLSTLAREVGNGVTNSLKALLGRLVPDPALKPVTDKAIESLFSMLSDPTRLQQFSGDSILNLVKDIGGALLRYVAGKVTGVIGRDQPAPVKAALEALLNGLVTEITQMVGDTSKMQELLRGGAAGIVALVVRVVRAPLGSLIDAVLPQAVRTPVKNALGELVAVIGDPRKLRELGVMKVTDVLGKLAPVVEQLLLGIFTQAVPAADLAPIRTALGKLRTGLANPGAATDEIRTAIEQGIGAALLRISDQRLRGIASDLVSLARELTATTGAQLRGNAKEILKRVAQGAVRFAVSLLPASPIRELVSAMLESVSGLFAHSGGLPAAFVQAAHEILPRITDAASRLLTDVLGRAISNSTVSGLVTGLLRELLGFVGHPDRWRQLREDGVGFVFSRIIPIARDFTVGMLGRVSGTGGAIMQNVVRSLFTFAAGMFSGGREAMRNFASNAVSAVISMGVGALKPVVVDFVRRATKSEPLATFLDSVMTELSSVLSNPRELQTFLGQNAGQAFTRLLGKAKDMVKRLIGGVLRDPAVKKLAEEGLDAVIEFATRAIAGGGRNLGEAAKGILTKVLPAFVDFAKVKLVQIIPDKIKPLKELASRWFDRIKALVTALLTNPSDLSRRLTNILGESIGDVVHVVKEPLKKIIGWKPLRGLVSNLLEQVGELLKDPAKLVESFQRGGKKAMELLLPKLDKVIGPFLLELIDPLPGGFGKDLLKTIIDAARGLLARPQDKLFKYMEMTDGKKLIKCIFDDFAPKLVEPIKADALKKLLEAGIKELAKAALGGVTCPR